MYFNAFGVELKRSGRVGNWVAGTSAAESQYGTSLNDQFQLTPGDWAYGGLGDDFYTLWGAATVVERAGEVIDTIDSRFWGAVTLPDHVENLILGGMGSTRGTGNSLDNIIIAVTAGAWIDGAGGNDVLVGGLGADVFQIARGNGSDVIMAFGTNDIIRLDGYGIASFAELRARMTESGSDTLINLGGGELLVIRDTAPGALSAADFRLIDIINTPLAPDAFTAPTDPRLMHLVGPGRCHEAFGWYVLNNAWGAGHLVHDRDYQLTGTYHKGDMTGGTTFTWDFPEMDLSDPRILAFPEVIFGAAPNGARANPTDSAMILPVRISDLHALTIDYDVDFSGYTSGFNVAFDIWLTSVPYGGRETITNEIMIWLHQGEFEAFGEMIGTYEHGGFAATIYRQSTYVAFVTHADSKVGSLDFLHMLKTLAQMGIVSPQSYVASIELGAEVASGHGTLTIKDLGFDVQTLNGDGTVTSKVATGSGAIVTTFPVPDTPTPDPDPDPLPLPEPPVVVTPTGTGGNLYTLNAGFGAVQGTEHSDGFYAGKHFHALAVIDGGGGEDQLALQGNYPDLVLGAQSLVNIESLVFLSGSVSRFGDTSNARYSYKVTATDANVAAGKQVIVTSAGLLAGESASFDGSAETDGSFLMFGGPGRDVFIGGARSDGFYFGAGAFGEDDVVVGGAGADDQLGLQGDFHITIRAGQMSGIETLALLSASDPRYPRGGGFDYDVTLAAGSVDVPRLTISAHLSAGETLTLDASAVTTDLRVIAGAGNDRIRGGSGNDQLFGGAGADWIDGGGGADTFIVIDVASSWAGGFDTLAGFDFAVDRIDLPGSGGHRFDGLASGSLSLASLGDDLSAALGTFLSAGGASLVSATSGDLAGKTFLVVDGNGIAGFQADGDFVFLLEGYRNAPIGPVGQADFIV